MSMLTPPGMGGQYRITGDRYPRMRRPRGRRKLVLGAVGAVVALGLIGWGTLQLIDVFSGGDDKGRTAQSAADCKRTPSRDKDPDKKTTAPGTALPKPAQIEVNVYNATQRTGLAKDTADELKKRGFKIGKVGNAPAEYDKKVKASGMLLGSSTASNGAFGVLGTQVDGVRTKSDQRKGKDIDLIIGDGFKDLVAKKDADKALSALATPAQAPAKPGC